MNDTPKESHADETHAIWARQFSKPSPAPSRSAPAAAATSTAPVSRPSTHSVWARQFGGEKKPVMNRASTHDVWAKQFNAKKPARHAACAVRSPDDSLVVKNGMAALGFRFSSFRASAKSPAEIRRMIASRDPLTWYSAQAEIEALGHNHPEFWKLVNEFVDAISTQMAA